MLIQLNNNKKRFDFDRESISLFIIQFN